MYVFAHPARKKEAKVQSVTYEMAQAEIAENSGLLEKQGGGKSKGEWRKEGRGRGLRKGRRTLQRT